MQKMEETVSKEGKRKFALWIRESTLDEVRKWQEADNCSSMSEFIEKAILFYIGYISFYFAYRSSAYSVEKPHSISYFHVVFEFCDCKVTSNISFPIAKNQKDIICKKPSPLTRPSLLFTRSS